MKLYINGKERKVMEKGACFGEKALLLVSKRTGGVQGNDYDPDKDYIELWRLDY